MKKIFLSTSIVGISTVVRLIIGILRSKVMAIILSPNGVGIVSQAFSFFTTASTITSLGLGAGIIRYISSCYKEEKKNLVIRQVVTISFILQMSVSMVLIVITILFADRISLIIFSTTIYADLLIVVALATPFATLTYLSESIFIAISNTKVFTLSRVWGYLIGFVPMFLLIYFWGIKGGFIQILIVSFVSFIFCLYYFVKIIPREYYLLENINELAGLFSAGGKIFKYGLTMLVSIFLASFSILFIRSLIIQRTGPITNGYYQVLVTFSASYLPFFTNALWSHFYPQASSISSSNKLSNELSDTIRFLTIGITLVIATLLIFKRYIIILLFSHKFIDAVPFLESHLVGDYFYLFSTTLTCLILARGKVKIFFLNAVFTNLIFISLSLLMFNDFGIFAITLSYAIAQLISALFVYAYNMKYLELSISNSSLYATFTSLVLLIFMTSAFDNNKYFYFKILALPLWLVITIKKTEWREVIKLGTEKWNRLTYQLAE